jgi:ABC-type glutathione transport system ATPase component
MLFDEPTSSLDPELVGEVLRVMEQVAGEGMTMLVATHEMGFAPKVADRVVFLDQGKILEVGPPAEVVGRPRHERTRRFWRRSWSEARYHFSPTALVRNSIRGVALRHACSKRSRNPGAQASRWVKRVAVVKLNRLRSAASGCSGS